MNVVVIGAGPAGLATAYSLAKSGHSVTVLEKERFLGGLSSSIRLEDDKRIEAYYHFLCLGDDAFVNFATELGLEDRIKWGRGSMSQFCHGKIYPFSTALDLLRFTPFSPVERISFGMRIFLTKMRNAEEWRKLEHISALEWLRKTFGEKAYEIIYRPLVTKKFGRYAPELSAAWLWARLYRVGKSRTRWTQREVLGYFSPGMYEFFDVVADQLTKMDVDVCLNEKAVRITTKSETVQSVTTEKERTIACDAIISTISYTALLDLFSSPPKDPYFERLRSMSYIGVQCLLLRLKKSYSPYFWMNISNHEIPFAGVIEYTNLNPRNDLQGSHIVYLPQYIPEDDPDYASPDWVERAVESLKEISPGFSEEVILEKHVHRSPIAQPICNLSFTKSIVPIESTIRGLYVTDSSQLHPDDRTMSNSISMGYNAAQAVCENE